MIRFFYNLLFYIAAFIAAPFLFFSKKRKNSVKERLGWRLPDPLEPHPIRIWIHTISVGETRAASSLFQELKKAYPEARFILSCVTETGYAEGLRSFPDVETRFILPLDFPLTMRRLIRRLKPTLFIQVESDFWLNILEELRAAHVPIALVNGKISETSFKRFKKISWFTRYLFSHFHLLCLQNSTYRERYALLKAPSDALAVTGNIKLDLPSRPTPPIPFPKTRPLVTIASTHPGEEALLLSLLRHLPVSFALAPRHPERCDEVAHQLTAMGVPFGRFSEKEKWSGLEHVFLIDAMGQLSACYSASQVAIIGGSFVNIGGHNLFEALVEGTPVLFGPYMHEQAELAQIALESKVAFWFEGADQVLALIQNPALRERCLRVANSHTGSTGRTLELMRKFLRLKEEGVNLNSTLTRGGAVVSSSGS